MQIPFDNSYARLPEQFYARQTPVAVAQPELIVFNTSLARALGLEVRESPELAPFLAGNAVPEGAEPLAQLYAGHQFGHFNPQLGDGRALLLGEIVDPQGQRFDIQLKGSGRTPFSRNGDGRAWLGPVLREYVVSEAMHALGVPTTRALAAVRTGQTVQRQTGLPGAVLTRVARSHIRVGTFQVFAARRDQEALQTLFEYTAARHYPNAQTPSDLLAAVIERQAALVAHWQSLGFIHGVMNTDNCSLSGETIDYGPCAFLDGYDPTKVFSSIDHHGRYGFSAQADVIVWNMAQLATALVPLMPDVDAAIEEFTQMIHAMPAQVQAERLRRFGAKLGLADPTPEDKILIDDLLDMMHAQGADFTNTFFGLRDGSARDQFAQSDAYDSWAARWQARTGPDAADIMATANPAYIPRNHQIEKMIEAAVEGDDAPFHRLVRVLSKPFHLWPGEDDLRQPPQPDEEVRATFCGT